MGSHATQIESAPVQLLAETGSTNEDALTLGRAGREGPIWIRAELQTAGRGRQGRVWASPVGNLYCSLLLQVDAQPSDLPQVAQVAGVALAESLCELLGHDLDLSIKWPNDVLLGGAKVAGILVEGTRTASGVQFCVIGSGVNCASFPADLPYRAISLTEAVGRPVDRDEVFAAYRARLAEAIEVWDDGRGYAAIRSRWLARALPLDTPLVVRGAQEPIRGRFQGIDAKGRLLLMGAHGPLAVEAGEVNLN